MVMDASPSPQSVGREFVRQYYTLLNKAPDHLHRFYNNSSSFVHGGLEPHNREAILVIGQKQIYNKIQQLNFRDCHAKISQVDAQSTLGNGVVVQVTGELSNDGQPMRRFTQTFVLAAQAPKKYYVHNDIFRYQDLYTDEEPEVDNVSEIDEDQDQETLVENAQQSQVQIPQQIYYPVAAPNNSNVGIQAYTQSSQMNGIAHDDLLPSQAIIPTTPQQLQQLISIPTEPIAIVSSVISSSSTEDSDVGTMQKLKDIDLNQKENSGGTDFNVDEVNDDHVEVPCSIEPKTYANLFKSESNSGISFASAITVGASGSTGSGRSNVNSSYSSRTPAETRPDPTPSTTLPSRNVSSNRPTAVRAKFEERRPSSTNQFGDNHQLFLGNVPHHATEDELRVIFGKFGSVVDLRIHSKSGPKIPGVRAPPNYGFITYDDPNSVQNCLSNMPLYFPDNSPDGQKLNVEEKKTRMRVGETGSAGPNRSVPGGNTGSGGLRVGNNINRGGSNSTGIIRNGPPGNIPQRSTVQPGGRNVFSRNETRGGTSSGGVSARDGNGTQRNGPQGGNTTYNRR